ncbi:hypothetical protein IFO69_20360 [Echinicola sp. CAU 1574]|uniref:Uncharacterized protein n=1 Tax=Echinicola arenosa TaxID=2774144 RepID=A0ABR9AU46_9BACT|nr:MULTISPECIES: hypothetical protein [Echinicola]MBD8491119.1 hypothetical protein [Echinicola arenosa]
MTKLVPILIGEQRMIQLSQLTIDQANDLRSFLPGSSIKKMNFQGMELHDCIDFETYEYWFQSSHAREGVASIWDF